LAKFSAISQQGAPAWYPVDAKGAKLADDVSAFGPTGGDECGIIPLTTDLYPSFDDVPGAHRNGIRAELLAMAATDDFKLFDPIQTCRYGGLP